LKLIVQSWGQKELDLNASAQRLTRAKGKCHLIRGKTKKRIENRKMKMKEKRISASVSARYVHKVSSRKAAR